MMPGETQGAVSGCGKVSSIRFVRQLEKIFGAQFLDRQLSAFVIKDNIQVLRLSQLDYVISHFFLNGGTFFNNLMAGQQDRPEHCIN